MKACVSRYETTEKKRGKVGGGAAKIFMGDGAEARWAVGHWLPRLVRGRQDQQRPAETVRLQGIGDTWAVAIKNFLPQSLRNRQMPLHGACLACRSASCPSSLPRDYVCFRQSLPVWKRQWAMPMSGGVVAGRPLCNAIFFLACYSLIVQAISRHLHAVRAGSSS
jgi:hypothetical protein